ncbi:centriolar homolog A [Octopus vulgaris]|uniref:Centriolar homolog A n=1 Tax=Octopus vulgaris TaxID=6645 RepID=A0AA36AR94_OCTVU|nr:centriolar homolog A [Octopus vulgaris]
MADSGMRDPCLEKHFKGHKNGVTSVAFSPTMKQLDHTNSVNSISIHNSGKYIISAADDNTLKIYDLIEGHQYYTLYGHKNGATACIFSPNGNYFASGGGDSQVLVWKTNFDVDDVEVPASQMHGLTAYSFPPPDSEETLPEQEHDAPARASTPVGDTEHGDGAAAPIPAAQNEGWLEMLQNWDSLENSVSRTLGNVVDQLQIVTQTMSLMERRLAMYEDKMKQLFNKSNKIDSLERELMTLNTSPRIAEVLGQMNALEQRMNTLEERLQGSTLS